MDEIVENFLMKEDLWDEGKGKLGYSGYSLSGEQQQRLWTDKTIAIEPQVLLMDQNLVQL